MSSWVIIPPYAPIVSLRGPVARHSTGRVLGLVGDPLGRHLLMLVAEPSRVDAPPVASTLDAEGSTQGPGCADAPGVVVVLGVAHVTRLDDLDQLVGQRDLAHGVPHGVVLLSQPADNDGQDRAATDNH